MKFNTGALATVLLATGVLGGQLPANVKNFYNSVRARGQCTNKLKSGFRLGDSADSTDDNFAYCADKPGIIYLQGKNGQLADMDIDCDGLTKSYDGDTRCAGSTDTQSQTSFRDELRGKHGISDLNAYVHSYVVFGNAGSKPGYVTFDPRQHGIEPLSVVAVVCNDQLFYGVWGDENGDDGAKAAVGEASIALASLCFGKDNVSGNNGHGEADVLYIAFQGEGAVTDAGVNWTTHSASEFQASLAHIGDQLVNQL